MSRRPLIGESAPGVEALYLNNLTLNNPDTVNDNIDFATLSEANPLDLRGHTKNLINLINIPATAASTNIDFPCLMDTDPEGVNLPLAFVSVARVDDDSDLCNITLVDWVEAAGTFKVRLKNNSPDAWTPTLLRLCILVV